MIIIETTTGWGDIVTGREDQVYIFYLAIDWYFLSLICSFYLSIFILLSLGRTGDKEGRMCKDMSREICVDKRG